MKGLQGKVVVVAGGATGIGAAAAARLGSEGARVLVGDINLAGAQQTAGGIVEAGGEAEPFEFDISDEGACHDLITAAHERWGAVHGLYNVAADLSENTLGRDADIVAVPTEVFTRTLAVNLMGFFYTSRAAIPLMLEGGGGSIVHTTSGVVLGNQRFVAYGASKGGIIAMSRHIATRYGKDGIRSNAIDPGITLTGNQLAMVTEEERADRLRFTKAARFGQPDEIAAMVAFLLSDEAPWINGQTYAVSSQDGAR
ncbi:hypothetical protein AU184_26350 [Mycolicibacterium novocastrense]|uniref:SDR family NAD(P)-dependent oxidoreductase n=1 Tax=Mycolicibacterium novocastrense TaxID=59813 RepID=UPI000749BA0D|nr:SDR family oxidoreductase [Mycolicibacterium novocastrense]KUH67474.1 hypothetical protein AU183_00085 [Mycolicibacterium novocastrense]KUH68194.1 hypothetical protein AU184_26350 [Mycolicibacterium novocastrense]KUH74394.1 hypothetical protein AU072_17395 [Mycolicibacterium novocastrense]